ncbi:MAG: helix-turn-helix transcriptional regulator [Ruegeria sp.]|uniref:AraC family transcriptional regulator n=1 Tax=Ruegeria sp. TaxID=1879320 RepID=UPI00349E67B0
MKVRLVKVALLSDARNRTLLRLIGKIYVAVVCLSVERGAITIEDSSVKDAQSDNADRPRYLGETIRPESGESYDWHTHDFGQLISAASGSMYVGTPDRVLLLSPAMAIWIPPDAEHWMRYGSNNVMLYVDVNRDEAQHLGIDCRVITMTPLLEALFIAAMPESTKNRGQAHNKALHTLLRHELISAQDVPLSLVLPKDARLHGVAKAALDDPGSVRSVEAWLSDVPASRKTIERLFVADTGMPPSKWLRHARVLHAVSLLASGQSVTSVAFDMGYESSSAFSYMFRQTLGVSPSEFLRSRSVPQ